MATTTGTHPVPPARDGVDAPEVGNGQVEGPHGGHRGGRIVGIDIARGLAILGMFTVHVPLVAANGEQIGGTAGALLAAPGGRAAVLFFLLSGVSLSIIAARGSRSADAAVLRRRGVVLLLLGLVISSTAIWAGSILEHYGIMFLIAPWLLLAGNRLLTILGIGGIFLGPLALLGLRPFSDDVAEFSDGAIGGVIDIGWSLGVDGIYPLLVWFGFFALGMRLGRLDLSARRVSAAFLIAGAAVAIAVPLAATHIEERVFTDEVAAVDAPPDAGATGSDGEVVGTEKLGGFDDFGASYDRDPRQLLDTTEHSGQIGWALQASAIAMAILGAALLLPRMGQRLLWPIAAVGSISLSTYLLHIAFVTDGWDLIVGQDPSWTVREQIGILIGLELVLVAIAAFVVWRWRSGPAERALRWLSRR